MAMSARLPSRQVAGVEAVPVGEFAGQPAHCGLDGHRSTVVNAFEHAKSASCRTPCCAGAHRNPRSRSGRWATAAFGPARPRGRWRRRCASAARAPCSTAKSSKRVGGFDSAGGGHIGERSSDDGSVRAGDDFGVGEIATPHPRTELFRHVLAELTPVRFVGEQPSATHLVAEVQCGRARTELLEHDEIDAVGIHFERHRQMLPAEVTAGPVGEIGGQQGQSCRPPVGLDVGRRDQRGLQRSPESAADALQRGSERLRPAAPGSGCSGARVRARRSTVLRAWNSDHFA